MPRYIYGCSCGYEEDHIHSMSDDPTIKCPKCKALMYRIITPRNAFVKGNCYLNKADCKKQAALSTLKDYDPYSKHRNKGEREELISKIKNKEKNRIIG